MADFFLDPAALKQATAKLREHGADLTEAFGKLAGVLDRHDGCWGKDDIGKAFEQNYASPAAQARQGARQTAEGIVTVGDNVDKTAKQFEGLDEHNAKLLDQSVADS